MRIVQLSDTHLSRRGGATNDNATKLIELINELEPTFVVHSGDVAILNPDDAGDRATAKELLAGISAPYRVLPGNHDVGEPGPHPWAGIETTSERVTAFTDAFGDDHWVEIVGGWAFLGLNSEVMGRGLPEEEAQWAWLETVPGIIGDRPVIGFCHKPLWAPISLGPEHQVALFDDDRERLLSILSGVNLKVWGSGHLHYYGLAQQELPSGEKIITVSAPATGFVNTASEFFVPGLVQQGVVVYDLEDNNVRASFRSRNDLLEEDAEAIPSFRAAMEDLGLAQLT